jgi:hypothetical protein
MELSRSKGRRWQDGSVTAMHAIRTQSMCKAYTDWPSISSHVSLDCWLERCNANRYIPVPACNEIQVESHLDRVVSFCLDVCDTHASKSVHYSPYRYPCE